jgi:hypothetical protein
MKVLAGEFKPGDRITAKAKDGELVFENKSLSRKETEEVREFLKGRDKDA